MDKRCARCHRKLTDPGSQAIGYGPSCAKKEGLTSHERPNSKKPIPQPGLFDDVEQALTK